MSKKSPGIRCAECGAWLDPGEQCDCATNPDITPKTRQNVKHNKAITKTAYSNKKRISSAYLAFDYK